MDFPGLRLLVWTLVVLAIVGILALLAAAYACGRYLFVLFGWTPFVVLGLLLLALSAGVLWLHARGRI